MESCSCTQNTKHISSQDLLKSESRDTSFHFRLIMKCHENNVYAWHRQRWIKLWNCNLSNFHHPVPIFSSEAGCLFLTGTCCFSGRQCSWAPWTNRQARRAWWQGGSGFMTHNTLHISLSFLPRCFSHRQMCVRMRSSCYHVRICEVYKTHVYVFQGPRGPPGEIGSKVR